jgi:hypothetical protein
MFASAICIATTQLETPMQRTHITLSVLIPILIAGVLPAPAFAQADKTPADQSLVMTKIDTDNDGTISLDEAKKAASTKFDALDTDKEGTLDATELTGIVGKAAVAKADKDKDSTLDKAEYQALVAKAFAAADTDKDGKLDAKEVSSAQGRELVALLSY